MIYSLNIKQWFKHKPVLCIGKLPIWMAMKLLCLNPQSEGLVSSYLWSGQIGSYLIITAELTFVYKLRDKCDLIIM